MILLCASRLAGDGTEVKAEALIKSLMSPCAQSTPGDTVDILDTAFTQARAAGYPQVAKRCQRRRSPPEPRGLNRVRTLNSVVLR